MEELIKDFERIINTLQGYLKYFEKLKEDNPEETESWKLLCNKIIQENRNQIIFFNKLMEQWKAK